MTNVRCDDIMEQPHSQERCSDTAHCGGDHMRNRRSNFDRKQTGDAHEESEYTLSRRNKDKLVAICNDLVCLGELEFGEKSIYEP